MWLPSLVWVVGCGSMGLGGSAAPKVDPDTDATSSASTPGDCRDPESLVPTAVAADTSLELGLDAVAAWVAASSGVDVDPDTGLVQRPTGVVIVWAVFPLGGRPYVEVVCGEGVTPSMLSANDVVYYSADLTSIPMSPVAEGSGLFAFARGPDWSTIAIAFAEPVKGSHDTHVELELTGE